MYERVADYERYALALHGAGFATEDVREMLRRLAQLDAAVDDGRCPDCGEGVAKTYEGLKTDIVCRHWFGYACACGFMHSRPETFN